MHYHCKLAVLAAAMLISGKVNAQQSITQVTFDSGSLALYSNAAKTTLLSGGGATTNNDGYMLQLGYYSQGTSANPFSGNFISLAGRGSLNTGLGNISIGDDYNAGAGNGTFALTLYFTAGSATTGNSFPAAGQQLVVQFYNGTTLATSTAYNAVTDPTFVWQTPASPTATSNFSLDDANLRFLGGTNSAFYTSQPVVPEPSTYVMGLGGLVLVACLVRRRQMAVA